MSRARCVFGLCAALCFVCAGVRAEGSAELDAADTPVDDAHDQAVDSSTVLHVDVLDAANEKLCYRGNNTNLDVYQPAPNEDVLVASLVTGACTDLVAGLNGAYRLHIGSQTIGVAWDVRVCPRTAADAACLSDGSSQRRGRLYSYDWSFQANAQYIDARSINGSVYAIVPGGAAGRDAVIEMQMRGVSGARYHLRANSLGPETQAGMRIGRSAPIAGNRVTPEYPLYLNPPAIAKHDWLAPQVQAIEVTSSCGHGVVLGRIASALHFRSNLVGQYVLICDLNRDGIYDLAADADFSAFGTTALGDNQVSWGGKSKGGVDVAPGTYACVVRLNVGEFHYIAEDIESAFPGIRMFRLEADGVTRTPLAMFWDDSLVPIDPEPMPNGHFSPAAPSALGLDPGAYGAPSEAFYVDGAAPSGNARAWGDFNADGKGNDDFLDQFSSAATTESPAFQIDVVAGDADQDQDGLSNWRECELGTDPANPDSDDDGVPDGEDRAPRDPASCRDRDADGCDDCSRTRANHSGGDPHNDGSDADADGICDVSDAPSDAGMPETPDEDLDDDGIPNAREGEGDLDGDGMPNALDLDSDGDGLFDIVEAGGAALDADGDGRIDHVLDDSPKDGLHDPLEAPGQALPLPDSDGDGSPDFLDADDDDDGRSTRDERADAEAHPEIGADADGDGIVNWLDTDSDADGLTDRMENAADGDMNHDGIPDYLQPDVPARDMDAGAATAPMRNEQQTVPVRGSLAGGALCAVQAPGRAHAASAWWLALIGLCVMRRRRAAAVLFMLTLACSSQLQAQVALSPFKPAPLASDGFALARPDVLSHLEWNATLLLDYANDPLVFERAGDRQQERVVSQHLQLHAAFALGLLDRALLFAQLPVHVVMSGPSELSAPVPRADGAGLGDAAVGGRLRLLGDPRSTLALSAELIARVPTAKLARSAEHYSGDAIGSYEPALIAELRQGPLALRARAGFRLRKLTHVGNLALDHELVYGVGAQYQLLEALRAHAELYGSTFLKEPWQRVHAPLELLLGLKFHPDPYSMGVAAGPGLSHGFGAPDVRIVAEFAYAGR